MLEFVCSTCLFSIYSDTLIRHMQSKHAKTLMFLKNKHMIGLCVKIIVNCTSSFTLCKVEIEWFLCYN